jgi:hypothetical protein
MLIETKENLNCELFELCGYLRAGAKAVGHRLRMAGFQPLVKP